jgi:release factor glutamine methyltransferase
MTKIEVGIWLINARARLSNKSPQPGNEAQALLSGLINRPKTWLIAHPEAEIPADLIAEIDEKLNQLAEGVPLAYLTGRQEFFGRSFFVSPDVLIPRPETELLVEHALAFLNTRSGALLGADVGVGSGCIPVSLVLERPGLSMLASDISFPALQVSRRNVNQYRLEKWIFLSQSDLLAPFAAQFDLITANLPYIPSGKLPELAVSHYEPRLALDGGADGMTFIGTLLKQISPRLAPGGMALLEIEASQREAALSLAEKFLPDANRQIILDLAGLPRLLKIQKGSA